jgi:hypothetical protein
MKNLFTPIIILAVHHLCGQPSFVQSQLTPVIGEKFTLVNFYDSEAGSGGSNQTWNFPISVLDIQDTTQAMVVPPSQTPFANQFSSANIAFNYDSVFYQYYKTGSAYSRLGFGIVDSFTQESFAYSDAQDELRFPLNSGTNYQDSYLLQKSQFGFSYKEIGKLRVFADGWGTITTPAATYSNVLRVVYIDSSMTIFSQPGQSDTSHTVIKSYRWYAANFHLPVFTIDSVFDEGEEPIVEGSFLLNASTTGIEDISPVSFQVLPNPADDFVTIQTSEENEKIISLFDVWGRELHSQHTHQLHTRLSLENLRAGCYIIRVSDANTKHFADRKVIKQ